MKNITAKTNIKLAETVNKRKIQNHPKQQKKSHKNTPKEVKDNKRKQTIRGRLRR